MTVSTQTAFLFHHYTTILYVLKYIFVILKLKKRFFVIYSTTVRSVYPRSRTALPYYTALTYSKIPLSLIFSIFCENRKNYLSEMNKGGWGICVKMFDGSAIV